MAHIKLAGTSAKAAGAMQPRVSFHTTLTLLVAHMMGCEFFRCAQSPTL